MCRSAFDHVAKELHQPVGVVIEGQSVTVAPGVRTDAPHFCLIAQLVPQPNPVAATMTQDMISYLQSMD